MTTALDRAIAVVKVAPIKVALVNASKETANVAAMAVAAVQESLGVQDRGPDLMTLMEM